MSAAPAGVGGSGGLLAPDTPTSAPGACLDDAAITDLGLDRVIGAAINAAPWLADAYRQPCTDPTTLAYRQAIAAELMDPSVAAPFERFVADLERLVQRLDAVARVPDAVARHTWFLAATERYLDIVARLDEALDDLAFTADGLVAARARLAEVIACDHHRELAGETAAIRAELDAITFTVRIQSGRVTVDRFQDEPDLSAQVAATFATFRSGAATPIEPTATEAGGDRITAQILALVAAQHPGIFAQLAGLHDAHQPLIAPEVAMLAAELPFYLGVLPSLRKLADGGLPLDHHPTLVAPGDPSGATAGYDLAVALSVLAEGGEVVTNDWHLDPPERILVVTGANQGGKTTFARAFAQLHHLAAIGLPVPAARATVGLHDRLRTHFERQEQLTTLRGKLQDELERLRDVLADATEDSVVVLNETFSSTTLEDARSLGRTFLERLTALGARVVFVTFVDELAATGDAVVSMVARVDEHDPTRRTFRIERRPPDGLAHALALAERYGLSQDALARRFRP